MSLCIAGVDYLEQEDDEISPGTTTSNCDCLVEENIARIEQNNNKRVPKTLEVLCSSLLRSNNINIITYILCDPSCIVAESSDDPLSKLFSKHPAFAHRNN